MGEKNFPISNIIKCLRRAASFLGCFMALGLQSVWAGPEYKQLVGQQVLKRLIEAKGNRALPQPAFIFSTEKKRIAWSDGLAGEVGLEEAAYDVCVLFGEDSLNALAAILAHELTHYYERHHWDCAFVRQFGGDYGVGRLDLRLRMETQADCLGGFLALAAGFEALSVMPLLLEKIYEAYSLPAEGPGYPSLEHRQRLAKDAAAQCEALYQVFEQGNQYLDQGQYALAEERFRQVAMQFQSREIFNNAGVAALYAHQGGVSLFPLQVERKSRLAIRTRNETNHLERAIVYLEQALSLDPGYVPALQNLSYAYRLAGREEDARYYAWKAENPVAFH